jgi:putative pyruvate formate lyase activating enzyme
VFFTGCTLRCSFCQNWQTSACGEGRELSVEELAGIFVRLQASGARNINAVTGTQFTPGILEALDAARARGLSIPLVWNSSGYETAQTVAALAPHTAFFLPDLKTLDPGLAREYLHAADYPAVASRAVAAMAEARPPAWQDGELVGGTIVRHLVLPGRVEGTRRVLQWFRDNLLGRAFLSLMFQYTPIPGRPLPAPFDRMTTRAEHERAVGFLEELGIEDGFFQEPVPDGSWLPDFSRPKPFSSELSRMVWHCRDGSPLPEGAEVSPDR